ncbi:MAG: DNA polymerase III subunit delta' [Proteobacteria bacterium]|nr:DNA polymerase III subunit delta' [Pseudomonadota bacterium]
MAPPPKSKSPKSQADEAPAFPHPRDTASLVGHEAAARTFAESFAAGRLAHAWLISGPRGIGKATLAYRFARHVLAASGPPEASLFGEAEAETAAGTDDPLEMSSGHGVFRRVASRGHADFLALELEFDEKKKRMRGEIIIDQMRRLGPFFGKTAGEGGWRVAIIDSCDELNHNAANALLKVLEEPPNRGLLLLVAHTPGRLLPTVRSRCRKLALGPLDEQEVDDLLAAHLPEVSAEDRAALARAAEGSPGRALALAANGGLGLYAEMVDLFRPLPGLDIPRLHALGDRLNRKGGEAAYRSLTALFIHWLERLVRNGAGGRPGPEVIAGEHAIMAGLAARRGLEDWIEVWEKVRRLVVRAESVNLERKQVVLNIFSAVDRAARG